MPHDTLRDSVRFASLPLAAALFSTLVAGERKEGHDSSAASSYLLAWQAKLTADSVSPGVDVCHLRDKTGVDRLALEYLRSSSP